MDLRKKCEYAGVHGTARRACLRSREVASVLLEAAWVGVTHCQHLMLHERWNCSLDKYRRRIMKRAFPETAFLQAFSAASVTHVVARSCALGRFTRCSCDDTISATAAEKTQAWRWGGCGDNVSYGQRLAQRYFIGRRGGGGGKKRREESPQALKASVTQAFAGSRDFKSQIDVHNAWVGITTVTNAAKKICKCHGPSGSCVMKTCWIQLPAFLTSGGSLKSQYQRSALARIINEAQIMNRASRTPRGGRERGEAARRRRKNRIHGNKLMKTPDEIRESRRDRRGRSMLGEPSQLVYLDASPNFCNRNKFGPGTRGRACERGEGCRRLCCGRGYDTSVAEVTEPCRCRIEFCCEVRCDNCTRQVELYTCK
ncbi:protein Wnt-9a-like isoform X2 [Eriocheir sinensis]|nr:protein Wnt-9a-like isoform X2 [Eriocheir sinensis]